MQKLFNAHFNALFGARNFLFVMKRRYFLAFSIMVLSLFLLVLANICIGSVTFSLREICGAFFPSIGETEPGGPSAIMIRKVIWSIRLPRILSALLLGGALALSGFLLQSFFGNPIAGPYVLGISSGAKLFVALALIFFLSRGVNLTSGAMVLAAFLGSLVSLALVLALSFKVRNMSVLVVCGIMIGYICSAVTDFFITFADDSNIVNLHNWSLGSFSGATWDELKIISVAVSACLFLSFFLSKPIEAYSLGESYARNLGVNIRLLRLSLILLSSVLSATVTAFAGPVSFVGIAVPHLVKSALKTEKPLVVVPACFLGGALVTLFCDGLARTLFAPTEFSISTVTAILLVPVVIWMMVRGKNSN